MIRPESRRRQVLREGEDRGSSAPHSRRKSHVQALDEHGYPRQVLLVWKVTVQEEVSKRKMLVVQVST